MTSTFWVTHDDDNVAKPSMRVEGVAQEMENSVRVMTLGKKKRRNSFIIHSYKLPNTSRLIPSIAFVYAVTIYATNLLPFSVVSQIRWKITAYIYIVFSSIVNQIICLYSRSCTEMFTGKIENMSFLFFLGCFCADSRHNPIRFNSIFAFCC